MKNLREDEAAILKVILAVRTEKDKTQGDVAGHARISRPFYTQIENGTRRLTMRRFLDICRALGESPVTLMQKAQT